MVRLRAVLNSFAVSVTFLSFNSNMVRLRERATITSLLSELFQFQYGAIESRKDKSKKILIINYLYFYFKRILFYFIVDTQY